MANKKKIDDKIFTKLYNLGMPDKEIARELNCSVMACANHRDRRELPSNQGLFSWQRKIKPSEFTLIPEKYKDQRLCVKE